MDTRCAQQNETIGIYLPPTLPLPLLVTTPGLFIALLLPSFEKLDDTACKLPSLFDPSLDLSSVDGAVDNGTSLS